MRGDLDSVEEITERSTSRGDAGAEGDEDDDGESNMIDDEGDLCLRARAGCVRSPQLKTKY